MTGTLALILMTAFLTKHYYADFPLQQDPRLYQHKHEYWSPWGWAHAGIHGAMSFLCVAPVLFIVMLFHATTVNFWIFILVCSIEIPVHHGVDFWKMNKNRRMGWGPTTHSEFWILLGKDQYYHGLTYIFMVGALMTLGQ